MPALYPHGTIKADDGSSATRRRGAWDWSQYTYQRLVLRAKVL